MCVLTGMGELKGFSSCLVLPRGAGCTKLDIFGKREY